MNEFTDIFRDGTAAIGAEYFILPLHGDVPVLRERVYCYELYHQMRCMWPRDSAYRLNGEVDKQNHPYFQGRAAPKPDLLVHQPGTGINYAVIEVKTRLANTAGIVKDYLTLTRFIREFGYQRALYLLYGGPSGEARRLVENARQNIPDAERVEIWIHDRVGSPAARLL